MRLHMYFYECIARLAIACGWSSLSRKKKSATILGARGDDNAHRRAIWRIHTLDCPVNGFEKFYFQLISIIGASAALIFFPILAEARDDLSRAGEQEDAAEYPNDDPRDFGLAHLLIVARVGSGGQPAAEEGGDTLLILGHGAAAAVNSVAVKREDHVQQEDADSGGVERS